MSPSLFTLTDWAISCLAIGVIGFIGQFTWNTLAADVLYWEDETPDKQIPPVYWPAAAVALFIFVAVFFYAAHWAGF